MKKVLGKSFFYLSIFSLFFNFSLFQNTSQAAGSGFFINNLKRQSIADAVNPSIVWWFNGVDTYTDQTAEAINWTDNDVTLSSTTVVNAASYVGYTGEFSTIFYSLENDGFIPRPGTDDNGRITWEYYDGDSWEVLTDYDDYTTYFDSASFNLPTDEGFDMWTGIKFTAPDDWAQVAVNGNTKYYIRARTSTLYETTAYATRIWVDQSTDNKDLSLANVILEANLAPTATVAQGDYTYYDLFYNIFNNNDFDLTDCRFIWQIDDNLTPIGLYAPAIIQFFEDYPEFPWPTDEFHQAVLNAENNLVPMEYLDEALFLDTDFGDLSEFYNISADFRTITIQNWLFPENVSFDFFSGYIKIAIQGDEVGTWPLQLTFMAFDQFGDGGGFLPVGADLKNQDRTEYGDDYVRQTEYLEVTPILPETGMPEDK